MRAEEIAKADEGFKTALEQRYGVTNMDLVVCDPWCDLALWPQGEHSTATPPNVKILVLGICILPAHSNSINYTIPALETAGHIAQRSSCSAILLGVNVAICAPPWRHSLRAVDVVSVASAYFAAYASCLCPLECSHVCSAVGASSAVNLSALAACALTTFCGSVKRLAFGEEDSLEPFWKDARPSVYDEMLKCQECQQFVTKYLQQCVLELLCAIINASHTFRVPWMPPVPAWWHMFKDLACRYSFQQVQEKAAQAHCGRQRCVRFHEDQSAARCCTVIRDFYSVLLAQKPTPRLVSACYKKRSKKAYIGNPERFILLIPCCPGGSD
eukprot:1161832-Pelagomonas_calceolata.AAC.10